MRRRVSLGVAALAATLLLAACGSSGAPAASGSSPQQMSTVRFVYDWPTPDFLLTPIIVAQDKGFYKAEGLNVQISFPPDNSTTMKILGIGKADVGFDTTTDVAFAKQAQIPVTAIGNFSQSNNWGLIGRPGQPIDLHALKGANIGIYTDSWTKAMLPFVLKAAGVTQSQVHLIIATTDVIPLLLSNKIQVATETTNYGGVEVKTSTGKAPEVLLAKDVGAPNVPIWVYAANSTWLQNNPDLARRWLAATEKGMEWASANPAQAVAMFEKVYPKTAYTHQASLDGWEATVPLLKGPDGYLTQTSRQWSELTGALKSVGELKTVLPASAYYTNRYIGG